MATTPPNVVLCSLWLTCRPYWLLFTACILLITGFCRMNGSRMSTIQEILITRSSTVCYLIHIYVISTIVTSNARNTSGSTSNYLIVIIHLILLKKICIAVLQYCNNLSPSKLQHLPTDGKPLRKTMLRSIAL